MEEQKKQGEKSQGRNSNRSWYGTLSKRERMEKLIDAMEDDDDGQNIRHNREG